MSRFAYELLNNLGLGLNSDPYLPESEISLAAVHRLIKKGGAGRIGDDAAEELRKVMEEVAMKVGKEALDLAKHAGRKTVRAEDVRLAVKRIQ